MTPENWIQLGAGWLGMLMHTLAKLDSTQKDARVANIQFDWVKDFFQRDIFGILLSFLCPVAWLIFAPELFTKYPAYGALPRFYAFGSGVLGSYLFQMWLGRSKKLIREAVNQKTDVADAVTADPIVTLKQVENKPDNSQE
jgi:hypothetical protein